MIATNDLPQGNSATIMEDNQGGMIRVTKVANGYYMAADSFDAHAATPAQAVAKLNNWGCRVIGYE